MNATRYLSYLDLMCCGFGGAVLMFLIVASARPEQYPTDQLLVVRCRATEGSSTGPATRRAEVGLEFRVAGEPTWERLQPGDARPNRWTFVAPSRDGSGTETLSIWRRPPSGKWEFRPYLIDFPAASRVSDSPSPNREVAVTFEALGRNVRRWGDVHSVLRLPGEAGQVVTIELRAN